MKKAIYTIIATLLAAATLTSCGSSKEKKAFNVAKEAYVALCDAADETIEVMDSIYGAWYFSIFEYDDFSDSDILSGTPIVKAFSQKTGLSTDSVMQGFRRNFGLSSDDTSKDYLQGAAFDNFSTSIHIVSQAYKLNGVLDNISENITKANSDLKTMTSEFDDYKHYPTLKAFYAKVSSYAEFAQSPTGSFQQLKDTINDYENSIRTYRSDLSFVFED